jgi:nucleotide-binding universal stress UspA family protein
MKILLAMDGSKYSETAARAVIAGLRTEGAEVRVLQVVEMAIYAEPPQMAQGYAPELEGQLKKARESVAHVAEMLREAGFIAEPHVLQGEVRTVILDTAEDWRADMIVLGSHGKTGLLKLMMGSVAESVGRHARCSVLIVRRPAEERQA